MVGNLSFLSSRQPQGGLSPNTAFAPTRAALTWCWTVCPLSSGSDLGSRTAWSWISASVHTECRSEVCSRHHHDSLSLLTCLLGDSPEWGLGCAFKTMGLRLWLYGKVFWMIMDRQCKIIIYIIKVDSGTDGFNPREYVSMERMSNVEQRKHARSRDVAQKPYTREDFCPFCSSRLKKQQE